MLSPEVERFLDEQQEDGDDLLRAYPESLGFRCIRSGDPVLVVGRAATEHEELVFRANADERTSLLVALGAREEVIGRLNKDARRTLALCFLGATLIVIAVVALLA